MLIGIDFDNTIVNYDNLFHRVALEQSLIPHDLEPSKIKVRDYLRQQDNENAWTEMQGYVYGGRMDEAEAYGGLFEFLQWANDVNADLAIISHKTKFPFIGIKYDLHAAARKWIDDKLIKKSLIKSDNIFFELTKEEKIKRIEAIKCDYFIDDLPEILNACGFPETTKKILFDPADKHQDIKTISRARSWVDVKCLLQTILTFSQ